MTTPRLARFLWAAACFVGCAIAAGCGGGSGITKHKVTGAVEVDGIAVPEGDLTFTPDDATLPPEGVRVIDGAYSVQIAAGTYAVKPFAPKKVPLLPGEASAYGEKDKIVNMFGEDTILKAEVTGPGRIDFKHTSKKK